MQITLKRTLLAAMTAAVIATPIASHATNGYFAHGYGTKNKGLAGGGSALPQDSMAAASNPAGMVHVGSRMDLGAAVFSPHRDYTFGPGGQNSESNYFLVPHFGRNWMLDSNSSFGVSVYGNGGMNTDFDAPGPFGGGETGVDLVQLFIAPTYSAKINDKVSWGASAIVAYQRFEAKGLAPFAGLGFSSDPTNLTNNGHDDSIGAGVKLGVQWEMNPGFTVAASYQSEIKMDEFDDYSGLFADGGDFDIPSTWTVGAAWKPSAKSAVTFDLQRINYTDVAAISNPISNFGLGAPGLLGASQGAGFGWKDMYIGKLGIQWETANDWTWRVGVSIPKDNPIPSSEALFNILAPATVEEHFTFGFTKQMGKNNELNFAAMYAPDVEVNGALGPGGFGPFPAGTPVQIGMSQYEVELSWAWRY